MLYFPFNIFGYIMCMIIIFLLMHPAADYCTITYFVYKNYVHRVMKTTSALIRSSLNKPNSRNTRFREYRLVPCLYHTFKDRDRLRAYYSEVLNWIFICANDLTSRIEQNRRGFKNMCMNIYLFM